jgi:hypothetical protein
MKLPWQVIMHLTERHAEGYEQPVVSEGSESAGAPVFLNEAEFAALKFGCEKNVFDYAARTVEKYQRMFAAADPSIIKAYVEGRVDAVIPVFTNDSAPEYDLVFFAIVDRVDGVDPRRPGAVSDFDLCIADHDGDKSRVGGVTQLVQGPNGVIPSFVRLERSKERHDFIRNVFAYLPADDEIFEFCGAFANRELGFPRRDLPRGDGGSVAGLIQDGPKGFQGFLSDVGASVGQPSVENELEKFLRAIVRIVISDQVMWLTSHECPNLRFKFGNVFAATRESRFSTSK